jgi:CRP-like cAMP-binding protein
MEEGVKMLNGVPLHEGIVPAQGEEGDKMFIVEAGVCAVRADGDTDSALLTPTMFFGELALLRNEVGTGLTTLRNLC